MDACFQKYQQYRRKKHGKKSITLYLRQGTSKRQKMVNYLVHYLFYLHREKCLDCLPRVARSFGPAAVSLNYNCWSLPHFLHPRALLCNQGHKEVNCRYIFMAVGHLLLECSVQHFSLWPVSSCWSKMGTKAPLYNQHLPKVVGGGTGCNGGIKLLKEGTPSKIPAQENFSA